MNSPVEEIELNIEQAKEIINKAAALHRLYTNKDFKELITEGYFKEEAIRLVHLKNDPSMQTEARQAGVLREIDGIGLLNSFFQTVKIRADMAKSAIEADEEELDLIRADGFVE